MYVIILSSDQISLAWKYKQYMNQASAAARVKTAYVLGVNRMISSGELSESDAEKWRSIDARLLPLQRDTKELLWHSRRRISRDFASSEEGLGKYPRNE
jgi:hypothetical protein